MGKGLTGGVSNGGGGDGTGTNGGGWVSCSLASPSHSASSDWNL